MPRPQKQGKSVQVLPTGERPRDHYINVPELLREHLAADGQNLIPDGNANLYLVMKAALGQRPVLVSELPDGVRQAVVDDARKVGWLVKDDTFRFGDMVLCCQPEEQRQHNEDQALARWAFQTEDQALIDSLNDQASQILDEMGGGDQARTVRANTITGGGAASHVRGGARMGELYPGGRGF